MNIAVKVVFLGPKKVVYIYITLALHVTVETLLKCPHHHALQVPKLNHRSSHFHRYIYDIYTRSTIAKIFNSIMDSRNMKRGRGNPRNAAVTTADATKKKAKEAAATTVEERKNEGFVVVEMAEMAELEEWAGLWSGVDEEMSWATCWCPFWEMEAIEDAYDALYGDVLWDFDIWDLKANGAAPNP